MSNRPILIILMLLATATMIAGCANAQSQSGGLQNATNNSTKSESGAVSNPAPTTESNPEWQEEFDLANCTLSTEGRNDYFILEPGFQLVLEGGNEKLAITVLNETIEIDGTMTRVVEEREWRNDEIIEVSYNFFAFCEETKDVF